MSDEKDKNAQQDRIVMFFKWLIILLFSLFLLIDLGIYGREIDNLHYLITIIILVAIASEKFDEIKIGNIVELKKIRKEFNEKIDKILGEIKQIQSQKQLQDQDQDQDQNQFQKQIQSTVINYNFPPITDFLYIA